MTDTELAEWDARQRAYLTSPQTLASFARSPTQGKAKAAPQPKFDTSEYA